MKTHTVTLSTSSLTAGLEKLARMRDELRVQIHLARLDARSEWERLEPKWWELEAKAGALENATVESAKGLKAAAGMLVEELEKGYERIRAAL